MLQLELDLFNQLEVAKLDPENSPLALFRPSLDSIADLDHLPAARHLAIAGDAFVQLSEFFELKAQSMEQSWKSNGNAEGPVLNFDDGLTRRFMNCDDDLTLEPEPITRRTFPKDNPFFDNVPDSEALMEVLGVHEAGEDPRIETVFSVIEEEDVGAWVDAISQQLEKAGGEVSLQKLRRMLKLSYGRLWLGILLGGFALESHGNFYGQAILVSRLE